TGSILVEGKRSWPQFCPSFGFCNCRADEKRIEPPQVRLSRWVAHTTRCSLCGLFRISTQSLSIVVSCSVKTWLSAMMYLWVREGHISLRFVGGVFRKRFSRPPLAIAEENALVR